MKVKVIQDSIIFVSALTAEDFQTANKFAPDALVLHKTDEHGRKKEPICSVGYAGVGGVNNNGIIFDSTTDEGKLCHTVVCTQGNDEHISTDEKLQLVTEEYADLILKMNDLEAQIINELEAVADKIATARNSIEAVGL